MQTKRVKQMMCCVLLKKMHLLKQRLAHYHTIFMSFHVKQAICLFYELAAHNGSCCSAENGLEVVINVLFKNVYEFDRRCLCCDKVRTNGAFNEFGKKVSFFNTWKKHPIGAECTCKKKVSFLLVLLSTWIKHYIYTVSTNHIFPHGYFFSSKSMRESFPTQNHIPIRALFYRYWIPYSIKQYCIKYGCHLLQHSLCLIKKIPLPPCPMARPGQKKSDPGKFRHNVWYIHDYWTQRNGESILARPK